MKGEPEGIRKHDGYNDRQIRWRDEGRRNFLFDE